MVVSHQGCGMKKTTPAKMAVNKQFRNKQGVCVRVCFTILPVGFFWKSCKKKGKLSALKHLFDSAF